MKLSTWMMNGYWKSFERKWKEFFFFLVSIQSTISISIDLEKSSLSRPADNYVPRGETRWIGEIDRRDRCRLEAAAPVERTYPAERGDESVVVRARSNMNERSDLSIAIEATTSLAHGGPSVEKHR